MEINTDDCITKNTRQTQSLRYKVWRVTYSTSLSPLTSHSFFSPIIALSAFLHLSLSLAPEKSISRSQGVFTLYFFGVFFSESKSHLAYYIMSSFRIQNKLVEDIWVNWHYLFSLLPPQIIMRKLPIEQYTFSYRHSIYAKQYIFLSPNIYEHLNNVLYAQNALTGEVRVSHSNCE